MFLVYLIIVQAQYFALPDEPAICCGEYEKNATNLTACPDYTCEDAINTKNGIIRFCPAIVRVGNYCRCEDGKYFNNCSKCVDFRECYIETKCKVDHKCNERKDCTNPCATDPNTEQRCINSNCERTCKDYLDGKTDECPTSSRECSVRCDCKPGYYRNSNYECVPAKQCYK